MLKSLRYIFHSYLETTGKIRFFWVIFSWILVSLITVLEPVVFTRIIKKIEDFYQTGVFDSSSTIQLIIFWGCFIVFSIIFQYLYRYFFVYKNNMKNYVELCKKFNKKILYMGYGEYVWKKQWSLYKIYDRGTQGQEAFLYFFFWEVVRSLSSIIIIVIILLSVDIRMTFLALSMVPAMLLLTLLFTKKLSIKQRSLNDKWDRMFGDIGNALNSFMLTKSLSLEKVFLYDMDKLLNRLHKDQNSLGKWWSLVNVYTGFMVMVARIFVLGFWVFFVIQNSLSFAELFLVFNYIGWIYFPLSFMIDRSNEMVKHLTSVQKMYEELSDIEKEDVNTGKNIRKIEWNISFSHVNFWYLENQKILKDINFEIKKWQKIALVGNTWAGKSTITNLLLRFWDSFSGDILLDGISIKDISKISLRKHIGVVSQDNSLFNLSIEENLKFSNPKATKKEIEAAIKKAQAEFIFDFPQGIKTVIWERGLKLSGWEKQRISIARLFLKNPEILILDEATSALDNKTEKLIQKSLDTLMKGKTSIIIAHRLSTIKNVDVIYVLENGKIVEAGNYEELMKKQWKFYTLANPDKLILG